MVVRGTREPWSVTFRTAARLPRGDMARVDRRGLSTGPVLLVLAVTALGLIVLFWSPIPWGGSGIVDPGTTDELAPLRDPGSNLAVTVLSCSASGDSLWMEGSVRNDGGVVVRYVEIALTWLGPTGDPVDAHVVFAVDGETFTPGQSAPFRAASGNPLATDCSARLFSYEPL